MKIKNARKLTALLLAVMMILPLISLPVLADDGEVILPGNGKTAPIALFFQDFEELKDGDSGKLLSSILSGPSTAHVVTLEDRGNVLQIDCVAVGAENKYFVHFNKDKNTWAEIISATYGQLSVEVPKTDEEGKPVVGEDGKPVYESELRQSLSGTMKTPEGSTYQVEGVINTNSCEFQVISVKDDDGNDVALKDIIVKSSQMINKTDAEGNVNWLPVLDKDGNPVIDQLEDANGNKLWQPKMVQKTEPVLDENGNPIMIQATDEDGNALFDENFNPIMVEKTTPVFDEDGQPVMVQEERVVLDENGNPQMDMVFDPVTGLPMFEMNEDGSYKIVNGALVPLMVPRIEKVMEPVIGELQRPEKIKVNNPSYTATSLYIVTDQFKDAFGGGVNNIAKPALIQHAILKSNVLIFAADYFFSADDPETPDVDEALSRGMDIRATASCIEDGKAVNRAFDFMSIGNPSNGKVTLKAHESDAKTQIIGGNKTIDLGTWVNIMIVADLTSGTYLIYIDGELMCIRQDADFDANGAKVGSHFSTSAASINAKTWNIGHFTRGGNVSDYRGFMQVDNVSVYDGAKLGELFDYMGYSKEFEEDYEGYEAGTVLDTYYNGASPVAGVVDLDGNKAAVINLSYEGNIDANFKPHTSAVTYLDSKTVVLEADYFLTPDAIVKFQSQLHTIGAHRDGEKGPFTYPGQNNNKTYQWIDLYTVDATEATNEATVTFYNADPVNGAAPSVTIEKGKWNTFSTVINLEDGSYTFYINGVYAMKGRLSKTVGGNNLTFTNVSFGKDQWIAAKVMKGSISRVGQLYIDEMMVTELGGGKAETMMVEAMLSAEVWANGEFYKTVTDNNIFYKSSDIEIYAEVFDLKEQVGTDKLLVMEGASIRFTSPTGLRFASKVDVDALNALYAMVGEDAESEIKLGSVSFGTLIAPTDTLNGKALTFENLEADKIPYLNIVGTKDCYYDMDGDETTPATHIAGSILDIKEENITRLFTGVTYISILLPNGIEYNIYSDRSYRASAQSVADDAYGEYAPEEQAVIDAFLAGKKPAADTPVVVPPAEGGEESGNGDGNDGGNGDEPTEGGNGADGGNGGSDGGTTGA